MESLDHPNAAIVDLDALIYNLRQIQRHLKGRSQVMAVVKANAYGHGAVPVARALEAAGTSFFTVAFVDEGIQLRQAGLQGPVLVMGGFIPEQVPALLEYKLTPVLFHSDHLKWLEAAPQVRDYSLAVHVKVDTGMGRLGLFPHEVSPFVKRVLNTKGLYLEGLMSHFSDGELEDPQIARDQIRLFEKVYEELKGGGLTIPCTHIANSAAMLCLEEAWRDWVRPGITLYGYAPSKNLAGVLSFKPVLTLRSRITHLRKVPAGTTISYGRTFTTQRESLIAVLPIGYADGYPRALSNRGHALVKGCRVCVVGRVCMDMTALDVTKVPEVQIGDEVVLLGCQGKEEVSAVELADKAGTIPYEILSSMGYRISRIYKGASRNEVQS